MQTTLVLGDAGSEVVRAFADLVGALAWPVVVLLLLWAAFGGSEGRKRLDLTFSRLRRVRGGGFELELTEQSATETRGLTREQFSSYRKIVVSEFDRQAGIYSIHERHQRLIDQHVKPALQAIWGEDSLLRSTIHVEDILFTDTLYQLLDYYPADGGPRGRTFPTRFGILGRAWRLRGPQVSSSEPVDDPAALVWDWGMTWEEAQAAGHGRESFAAVPLLDEDGIRVGIVYLDAQPAGAFGEMDRATRQPDERAGRLIAAINAGSEETKLAHELGEMMRELRKRGPAINIHEAS